MRRGRSHAQGLQRFDVLEVVCKWVINRAESDPLNQSFGAQIKLPYTAIITGTEKQLLGDILVRLCDPVIQPADVLNEFKLRFP